MKPTICRTVHFTNIDGETCAAIITGVVNDTTVHLHVFEVERDYQRTHIVFSETPKPDHWTWPPRV